jgi:hypothetical protein
LIENGAIHGSLLNAYWSESTFSWPLQQNWFSLNTKTTSKEWNITQGTIWYEKTSNNSTRFTYNLTQKHKMTSGEKKISLTHTEYITPTSPFLVQKPNEIIKSSEIHTRFINLVKRVADYMADK